MDVRSRFCARGRFFAGAVTLCLTVGALALSAPTHASFPGTNGLIAYVSGGNVFVVNPSNAVPVQITNTGNFSKVGYNATGSKLAASNPAGLVLLDPIAGSPVTLIPNSLPGDTNPAFSPDGSKLAFNTQGFQIGTIEIPGGTNRTVINTGPGFAAQPDWSASGSLIAFSQPNAVSKVSGTGGNLTILFSAAGLCPTPESCSPTVSPDNTKVIFARAGSGLRQVNADGTTVTPALITSGANDAFPSYSPDATRVVFQRAGALNTAATDGSTTATPVGAINGVIDTSWGVSAAAPPPPGGTTFSITGPAGKVKSGPCVFTVTASAPAIGSVNFTTAVVSGKNTPNPASGSVAFSNQTSNTLSIAVKHSRKKKGDVSVTLTSATGGTVGTPASATCDVGKK
jgi:hypothetical protein